MICKQLAEMMGGGIEVQSAIGQGSTFSFTVTFPGQQEHEIVTTPCVNLADDNKCPPMKILVAEDNLVNQRVLSHLLRKLGQAGEFVSGGLACLDRADKESYDVVLMDVQMPDLDGMEASRRIRALPGRTGNSPWIIALTADAMPEDRQNCLAAGMNDYVSKPIREQELRRALATFVAQRACREESK